MALSDKAIKAALKAAVTAGKAHKLCDGAGLFLDARPTGAGWWRLRYRYAGRENMLSLGTYPRVTLAEARRKRDEARAHLAHGVNPSEQRKAGKVPAPATTFEQVAREWLAVHASRVSAGHVATTRTRLAQDVFPFIGARPLAEIEAPELLAVLRRVEARGALETTRRIRHACGQVFRYGMAMGVCARNPAADLVDALRHVAVRHHAAIIEPAQVGALLRDMDAYIGSPVTRAALALSALLMLRPGELRHMEWDWVDFATATLTIPAACMKRTAEGKASGAPHVVPLATQAVQILLELLPLTGGARAGLARYVFPALTQRGRCMSENTVRAALRRLGYANEDMTAHGFRAMARTLAAEQLGIEPLVIEAQLAHRVPDSLGRAYNRTQYLPQRRELMQRWADYLDVLRRHAPTPGPDGATPCR